MLTILIKNIEDRSILSNHIANRNTYAVLQTKNIENVELLVSHNIF